MNQGLTIQQTRQVIDTIIDRTRDLVEKGLVDEVLTVGNHADGPYLLTRMQKENHPGFEAARRLLLSNGGNRVGEKIACVSWDGTVYADQFWRNYPLGNVLQTPFDRIWSDTDQSRPLSPPQQGYLRRFAVSQVPVVQPVQRQLPFPRLRPRRRQLDERARLLYLSKLETRSTKSETNPNDQNPKEQNNPRSSDASVIGSFEFRACFGFEFRNSCL